MSGQVMSSHVMSGQVQASCLTFQKRNRQEEGRPPYLWPQRSRRLEWKLPQGWPRPPLPGSENGVFGKYFAIFEYFHPCASGGQPLCLWIVIRSHWNLDFIPCVCCRNLHVTRIEICHDRHDQPSCKICSSCVNFPRKQRDFLHNLRRTTRFTHTECDFALKVLKFYTLS